ncbi:MAG: hypothetical protein HEQ11_17700 [Gemmatimonas sp.]|nr:hypothetical protein [Gemmatimonas sp.]
MPPPHADVLHALVHARGHPRDLGDAVWLERERGDDHLNSVAGDGLTKWTSANRPIANTDLVTWLTPGFHHVPRPEDWPVMPVAWHRFAIKPVGFFGRSPQSTFRDRADLGSRPCPESPDGARHRQGYCRSPANCSSAGDD